MSETARIAVLIPCYRDGVLAAQAVASIDEGEPVEIVVIDDASDDPPTEAALAGLEGNGVIIVRQRLNTGPGRARISGLAATTAPYVFPLDADDLAVPGALGAMADRLDANPDAVVCYGDYVEFGETELMRAVPDEIDPFRLAYTNEYPISAMFRRSALESIGLWPGMRAYEDWHVWMTFAERGLPGVHLGAGSPTYKRRLHGDRLLTAAKTRHSELYGQLRRDHPRLFAELGEHRRRSSMSRARQVFYPVLYGSRRRWGWEAHVKRMLDRVGVWTMRR
jgi:glycosyltransferase involved in cell wall biosynthesis